MQRLNLPSDPPLDFPPPQPYAFFENTIVECIRHFKATVKAPITVDVRYLKNEPDLLKAIRSDPTNQTLDWQAKDAPTGPLLVVIPFLPPQLSVTCLGNMWRHLNNNAISDYALCLHLSPPPISVINPASQANLVYLPLPSHLYRPKSSNAHIIYCSGRNPDITGLSVCHQAIYAAS